MEQRYIQRYRLPDRLYCPGAPVVLAAGRVLEDTKQPRLVAQLKFKSVDPRPIAALSGTLCCLDVQGRVLGDVPLAYEPLAVRRGDAFGQYTAVVLPWAETDAIRLTALEVRFEDGAVWSAPEGASWVPLPPFEPLEAALQDAELLALSRRELPGGKYAYTAGNGLWYCTCGGVNREDEPRCHRCGRARELTARCAGAAGLAALRQERLEEEARRTEAREQARREAEAKAAALKAAAEERARKLRERFAKKAAGEESAPPDEPAEAQPLPTEVAAEVPAPAEAPAPAARAKRSVGKPKGKLLAGIAALVLVAVLAAVALPRLLSGGAVELHVTTPGDTGEVMTLRVQEDEEGVCVITPDLVRDLVPGADSISFGGVPDLGDDIHPYIINSYHMACLVTSHGEHGAGEDWGSFDANRDPDSPVCLLVFGQDLTRLVGYAINPPRDAGGGAWELDVTLCDYDFSQLVEEQIELFEAGRDEVFSRRIQAEDIADSGAEWFLFGYNTGRGATLELDDPQAYHIWSQCVSEHRDQFAREMDRLESSLPDLGRWRCFLLLDDDREPLGYVMLDHSGSSGPTGGSGDIESLGTVDLYLEEENNRITLNDEVLQEVIPEEAFFNFEGYAINMNGDMDAYLTDSFHMAWLVTSEGTAWGGNSSAIWDPSTIELCTLMVYSDFTRLCGYFIGVPEDLGGGRWRIEITLCDYDFTQLYAEQAAGYDIAPQLPEISESQLAHSGAAWFIEPVQQLSGNDDFTNRVRLQSLWSRATSPNIRLFARPIEELPHTARRATADRPEFYLLLNADYQYLGYVRITDGERVEGLTLEPPAGGGTTASGTVNLDLTATNGMCRLEFEQVQELIPQATRMELRGNPNLGSIEEYLRTSDNMAWLIAHGETLGQTNGQFSVQGGRAPFRSLLIFSGPTQLCGYFMGEPVHESGDRWRLEITLCDYDFTGLLEQQRQAFARWEVPPYVEAAEADSTGAKYVITGFYTASDAAEDMSTDETVQLYSLWSQSQSIGVGRFCQNAEHLESLRPEGPDGRFAWVYCLLLDADYQPVAYTILTNEGGAS